MTKEAKKKDKRLQDVSEKKIRAERRKISPEIKAKIKSTMRSLMVRYPLASKEKIAREVSKLYKVSERTLWTYFSEIKNEALARLEDLDVKMAVSDFAELIYEAESELWKDVKSEDPRVRQNAIKLIVDHRKKLFDLLMDTGFIVRQLGEQRVKHAFLGALAIQVKDEGAKEKFLELRDYVEKRLKEIGLQISDLSGRKSAVKKKKKKKK